jgi:hypothetical protein
MTGDHLVPPDMENRVTFILCLLVFLKQDNPARNQHFHHSKVLKTKVDDHFPLQNLWFRPASPDIIKTQAFAIQLHAAF